MSVVTSVPAFFLNAVLGSRMAPRNSLFSESIPRKVESSLSSVWRDVTNMSSPPGLTLSSVAAKK